MKKAFLLSVSMFLLGVGAFAQDSTVHKAKKAVKHAAKKTSAATHKAAKETKEEGSKVGDKIDTTAKKTGHFFKRNAKALASSVSTSEDKSMKGPNGETVYNGKRGGKYYIAKSGKKVYLKKDRPDTTAKSK